MDDKQPLKASRRKMPTANNNNAGEEEASAPKKKMSRVIFHVPMPERSRVLGLALVCGQGDVGQLGLGDHDAFYERKRPTLLGNVKNVVDVCAGGMHNLLLTNEGRVFSFGCNDEGALGRDSSKIGAEFDPAEVKLPGIVIKVSAGDSHSAVLLTDGRVFAWGSFRDSHGNMGLTLEGNKRLPIDVLPGQKCSDIASGADHLVILTRAGKVYTVGCGEQGQLGRVSSRSLSGEGRRGKTELLRPAQVVIKRVKHIDAIWASNYCTFLREAGTENIWGFGLNNYKQLAYNSDAPMISNPVKTNITDAKQIAGGQHHTLVLKKDGSCYAIGRRDYGRLGLGELKEDVTELRRVEGIPSKVVHISCGESQSFAVTDEGKLYSWGMGSNHQLGTGTENDALVPVLIKSKQTEYKRLLSSSGGGQHSIFLVLDEPAQPPVKKIAEPLNEDKKEEPQDAVESKKMDVDDAVSNGDAKSDDASESKKNATDKSKDTEEAKIDAIETAEDAPEMAKGGIKPFGKRPRKNP